MKDVLIQALGIFLNDFPYFILAMAGVWNYLRVSKRQALLRMVALTLVHAASILLLMRFYPNYRAIQIPHELFYLALYVVVFFFTVRIRFLKLLFMFFFVKLFADVMTSLAAFIEMNLWPDAGLTSFGLAFNIAHLMLLLILYPPMYLYVTKQLRPLILVESRLWRFLWLLPFVLYALQTAFTLLNKTLINTTQYIVLCSLLVAFSLLVHTLILETFKSTRERTLLEANVVTMEKMLVMQDAQYRRITTGIEATRQARHDIRHQLAVMNGYLKNNDIDGAKRYCDEIARSIPTNYDKRLCDNFAVNAVAQHYAAIAERGDITLSLRLAVPSETGIASEGNLCVVIGNLMENGIEACLRQELGKRFITLSTLVHHDYLAITMDNSFDGMCRQQGKEYLSRKHEGMGIGLASIIRIADKNGGNATFEQEGSIFRSSVILRMHAS